MSFILKVASILTTNLLINFQAMAICYKLQNKKCLITQQCQILFFTMYCLVN